MSTILYAPGIENCCGGIFFDIPPVVVARPGALLGNDSFFQILGQLNNFHLQFFFYPFPLIHDSFFTFFIFVYQ